MLLIRRTYHLIVRGIRQRILGGKQSAFTLKHFAAALSIIPAQRAICSNHTVARHFRSKWITFQRLPHSLSATATYPPGKFAISYSLPGRHIKQFKIHLALK